MITPDDLCWHHKGTTVFAIHSDYTITDAILSNPKNTETRYSIYAQYEGDEIHLESYPTIDDVLAYLNNVAA